jgi:hypothetical protein
VRALGLIALFLFAAPARGELVVLVGGDVLKVTAWTVEESRVRLELPSGGGLTLSLSRVERIVEDEIEPPIEKAALPSFSIAFDSADPVPATPYGELFWRAGERHAVSPRLLVAMAHAESAFDVKAVSRKGARGLLQVMPATGERFGVSADELFDPDRNLHAAAGYVSWLAHRFDFDLAKVLAAYNAGETVVDRYGGIPPYRETQGYVRRVYAELGLAPVAAASGK